MLSADMQIVKNTNYRNPKLDFWNRILPDLVTSSGITRDSIMAETFPGATYPTITFVPTVLYHPLLNDLYS